MRSELVRRMAPLFSSYEEHEVPNLLLVSLALALVKLAYRDPWTGRECKRLVLIENDLLKKHL